MNAQASSVAPAYRVLDGHRDVQDPREAAVRAWQGSLDDGNSELLYARYDALCVHSPNGAPVIRFIDHVEDGIVGFLALAPRRMLVGGREVRAGVLSHFAIRPGHRSLGPALMLIDSVLAAAEGHFDLVYGIPNASQGVHAAFKRAGLRPAVSLERMACVVRHGHYFARVMPRYLSVPAGWAADAAEALVERGRWLWTGRLRGRWLPSVDPVMVETWSSAPAHPALTAVRDEGMLRWRLDRGVGIKVQYLVVEDSAGRAQAWFACSVEPRWPHILDVRDFWSVDARDGIPCAVLRILLREARRRKYSAVSVRAAMEPGAAAPWRQCGFKSRGEQKVIIRWLAARLAATPPPLHLTYIDQDG